METRKSERKERIEKMGRKERGKPMMVRTRSNKKEKRDEKRLKFKA